MRSILAANYAQQIEFPLTLCQKLACAADGDGSRCLNHLEIMIELAVSTNSLSTLTEDILQQVITEGVCRFDNKGDEFYEQISALHKSVRGSDPDAAYIGLHV